MRIAMLSQNEWRHDSRVMREAEALARLGHDVHVVCRSNAGHVVKREELAGVIYTVVPRRGDISTALLLALFRAHAALLLFDALHACRRRRPWQGLRSGARLIRLLAIFPLAAGVLGLLKVDRRATTRLPGRRR